MADLAARDALRLMDTADDLLAALKAYEAEREDLEDRAPVDPFCGDCNMGAGPNKRTCAHHLAVAAIKKAEGR